MTAPPPTKPVEDSVAKVNNEVAVGADLEFQRHWWRFENGVWVVFALLVLLDVLGVFGRGYFAKAQQHAPDGSVTVKYERIARYSTPSLLTVEFGPSAIHDGQAQLWVSESLIKVLGNQRIAPQPASSAVGQGGVLYTFPATNLPATVEFALEPTKPGMAGATLRVPGNQPVEIKTFVMP